MQQGAYPKGFQYFLWARADSPLSLLRCPLSPLQTKRELMRWKHWAGGNSPRLHRTTKGDLWPTTGPSPFGSRRRARTPPSRAPSALGCARLPVAQPAPQPRLEGGGPTSWKVEGGPAFWGVPRSRKGVGGKLVRTGGCERQPGVEWLADGCLVAGTMRQSKHPNCWFCMSFSNGGSFVECNRCLGNPTFGGALSSGLHPLPEVPTC